jgi:hypothetical protein
MSPEVTFPDEASGHLIKPTMLPRKELPLIVAAVVRRLASGVTAAATFQAGAVRPAPDYFIRRK